MTKSQRNLFFLLTVFSLTLFSFDRMGLLIKLKWVSDPFVIFANRLVLGLKGVTFFGNPKTAVENSEESLQKTNEIIALSSRLGMLEEENKALRRELEGVFPKEKKRIIAAPLLFTRYLLVDKGERDGIQVGQTVMANGILVGKIEAMTPHTASILLPTDPDASIPVWTPKLTRGTLKGSFGRMLKLEQVLQADPLEVGDTLLTSGDSGYLQNVAIGKVISKVDEARLVYKTAEVAPFLDVRTLRVVSIVYE